MTQEIQRALDYSRQRNRQLNVVGDANFSHEEDRHMKIDRGQHPDDVLKGAGLPQPAGMKAEETNIALRSYLSGG